MRVTGRIGTGLALAGMLLAAVMPALAEAPAASNAKGKPTTTEARAFIEGAEQRLKDLSIRAGRAAWVQVNFITDDTEQMAADAQRESIAATMELAAASRRFDGLNLPEDVARKIHILRNSQTLPAPSSPAEQAELSRIATSLESDYGKGRYCPGGRTDKCLDINALSKILATSRDPDELLDVWKGWRTISPPMRERYERFVVLANEGARDLGFKDLGALWRSDYDMTPEALTAEVERLWHQVRPLYLALHAHVRASLEKKYGAGQVTENGLLPAHLLGNMWAQSWGNIYALAAPAGGESDFDLTATLVARKVDDKEMVRMGERFFTSLGFEPFPETFWKRSLFTKPADRDVVCHASAWDIDLQEDLRIKMCIEINEEDFQTVHHELGHLIYDREYRRQPYLLLGGAHDGFHEAVGDTVALSITPGYLRQIGLMNGAAPAQKETVRQDAGAPEWSPDLAFLMKMALEKVAFLPFGLVVDQWRWKVFSGEVQPAGYNRAWWDLVEKYQGVRAPVARSEADFDPGAKYHVPANTPYTRYFLAHILQFQFHRGLCRTAGFTGPLHECSIYGNTAAGDRLRRALAMGRQRPWPEALEALTGEKRMDATAMLDYFAPLKRWLDEQNRGRTVGF